MLPGPLPRKRSFRASEKLTFQRWNCCPAAKIVLRTSKNRTLCVDIFVNDADSKHRHVEVASRARIHRNVSKPFAVAAAEPATDPASRSTFCHGRDCQYASSPVRIENASPPVLAKNVLNVDLVHVDLKLSRNSESDLIFCIFHPTVVKNIDLWRVFTFSSLAINHHLWPLLRSCVRFL